MHRTVALALWGFSDPGRQSFFEVFGKEYRQYSLLKVSRIGCLWLPSRVTWPFPESPCCTLSCKGTARTSRQRDFWLTSQILVHVRGQPRITVFSKHFVCARAGAPCHSHRPRKMLKIKMGINLSCADVAVAQKLLHRPQLIEDSRRWLAKECLSICGCRCLPKLYFLASRANRVCTFFGVILVPFRETKSASSPDRA